MAAVEVEVLVFGKLSDGLHLYDVVVFFCRMWSI